jgi:hypothetical protein
VGMAEAGFGRGPGSLALKWTEFDCARTAEVTAPARKKLTSAIRMESDPPRFSELELLSNPELFFASY